MTLAVSYLDFGRVVHASDRLLVTRLRGQLPNPFDRLSNKTVLFSAADGMFALSYTGAAYLEEIPTDTWVAQELWGNPISEWSMGVPAITLRGEGDSISIFSAMPKLAGRLQAVHMGSGPFDLDISGWCWKRDRRRARPFHARITNRVAPGHQFSIQGHVRNWYAESLMSPDGHRLRKVVAECIGWPVKPEAMDVTLGRIGRSQSADETISAVVGLMEGAAGERGSTVGSNYLVIYMPRPSHGKIYVLNRPTMAAQLKIDGEPTQAALSPWIVTRFQLRAPAVLIGSWPVEANGMEILLVGSPPAGDRYVSLLDTLERPDARGKRAVRPNLSTHRKWPSLPPTPAD